MQLPVLTMVCGYSRWLSAILIPTRRAEDLFAGWWHLIHALGVVPRRPTVSSDDAARSAGVHATTKTTI